MKSIAGYGLLFIELGKSSSTALFVAEEQELEKLKKKKRLSFTSHSTVNKSSKISIYFTTITDFNDLNNKYRVFNCHYYPIFSYS